MEGCFSADFGRWCLSRDLGERGDLRRIVNRVGFHSLLESFVLDLSTFEGGREMGLKSGSGSEVSVKQYSRLSDGFTIVVKSFDSFDCDKVDDILYELFMLTQLKHQCIAPVIGIVLPTKTTGLQTGTLYYRSGSLEDVTMNNPVWWTPTTKAKTIAGIALGMRYAHRHGIVHGSLKPNNILFDEDHCVHIVDFCSSHFRSAPKDMNGMSEHHDAERVEYAKESDVFSFTSIILYILADHSTLSHSLPFDEDENQRTNTAEFGMIPAFVPKFVQELIANGWSEDRFLRYSFEKIIEIMKENNFLFTEAVDVWDTLEFVNTAEESSF
jgi:serine/threonine protein kinase